MSGRETTDISIFQGIDEPGLKEALSSLPVLSFPRGIVIFDQGERSRDLYHIVSGTVEIVRRDGQGNWLRVALLGPGDLFGEIAFLDNCPRTTAAVAFEPVSLIELTASWLDRQSERHEAVRKRIFDLYRIRVLIDILRSHPVFRVLSEGELDALSRRLSLRVFPPGATLISEGSSDEDLFVIRRGCVEVTKTKDGRDVLLSALRPGDLLGEMAVVTGGRRSASAVAAGEVEVMVLPGQAFKEALGATPSLLDAVEDVVRSRAQQAREALEAVIEEVVGAEWKDDGPKGGIEVHSLKVEVEFESVSASGRGVLVRVSRSEWAFDCPGDTPPMEAGMAVRLSVRPGRVRELTALSLDEPLEGLVAGVSGYRVCVAFDEAAAGRVVPIVTVLARSRVRLFVYPEYDVRALDIALNYTSPSGSWGRAAVTILSRTHALTQPAPWSEGEVARIAIERNGVKLPEMKALSLGERDGGLEIQFEYETGEERLGLEQLIAQSARDMGYGQVAVSEVARSHRRVRSAIVLTKHFSRPSEFLRDYMSSVDAGVVLAPSKDALPRGSEVRVHLMVGGRRGVASRLALSGLVRQWAEGEAEVELDELTPLMREKIGSLCGKLVEERTAARWEERRGELRRGGAVPKVREASVSKYRVAFAALLCAVVLTWALRAAFQSKEPDAPAEAEVETVRVLTITLDTSEGPVTLRSSDIRAVSLKPGGDEVEIGTHTGTVTAPASETAKLPAFHRRQMERLRERLSE